MNVFPPDRPTARPPDRPTARPPARTGLGAPFCRAGKLSSLGLSIGVPVEAAAPITAAKGRKAIDASREASRPLNMR